MQSFYTSLDYQDLLEVSGENSEKFLQGQLTCDLARVPDHGIQLGAACNNKGRVYSSFRLLKHDGRFFLAMQPGLLAITQQKLGKYIPFYKAEMADAGARFHRIGLAGPEAQARLESLLPELPAAGLAVTAGDALVLNPGGPVPRYELWLPGDDNPLHEACDTLEQADAANWQALDLEAGIFLINADDVEQYTPEEANMDLAGFIHFDKGCYTGQEIVARMHYRGKAGKRLFKVELEGGEEIAGNALKDSSGKTLGNLVNLLYLKDKVLGFVVLKAGTDTTQSFVLENGAEAHPVNVTPLSYA